MKHKLNILTLTWLLLMAHGATSAYALDENTFTTWQAAYLKGIDGSESDLENAIRYFDNVSEAEPYDIFVNTYRGSLRSRMAQHVYMPWNKMKHVDAGSEFMDDALDEITEIHERQTLGGTAISFRMKLVVAHTYSRFPRFLNRYQDAKDLVTDLLASPQLATASTDAKNSLYGLAAAIAEDDGDKTKQSDYLSHIVVVPD